MALNRRPETRRNEDKQAGLFVVACDGSSTEVEYFGELKKILHSSRFKIEVVPPDGTRSGPENTVERMKEYIAKCNVWDADQFWVVIDIDHNLQPQHIAGLTRAIQLANQSKPKINLAFSNPCFEVWFIFHADNWNLTTGTHSKLYEGIVKKYYPGYSKNNVKPIPIAEFERAMEQARVNRAGVNAWPDDYGTDVFKLFDSLILSLK